MAVTDPTVRLRPETAMRTVFGGWEPAGACGLSWPRLCAKPKLPVKEPSVSPPGVWTLSVAGAVVATVNEPAAVSKDTDAFSVELKPGTLSVSPAVRLVAVMSPALAVIVPEVMLPLSGALPPLGVSPSVNVTGVLPVAIASLPSVMVSVPPL